MARGFGRGASDAAFKRASVRLPERRGGGGSGLERLLRHVEAVRPWRGIRLREERFELGGKIRKDVGEGKDRLRAITDELLATFGIFRADAAGHGVDGAVLLKREPGGDEAAAAEGGFHDYDAERKAADDPGCGWGNAGGPEAFRARIPK